MLLALTAGSFTAPATASTPKPTRAPADAVAASASGQCPTAIPVSKVHDGMKGYGLTVVRGNKPQRFDVKVLGVLTDGIGPGRDLILVEVSDITGHHVIDQGGGIWEGMSGSPVYIGNQLLGAVSYGFSLSPSPIGGVTPAADMKKVLNQGSGSQGATSNAATQARTKITLSKATRRQLTADASASVPRGTLDRLATPLSVSGLSAQRLKHLQSDADAAHLPLSVYAGSSRSAPTAKTPQATPVAGGNFAAAFSFGDVTAGGVGTTTAVCGSRALAWGHPFNLEGATSYVATDADSLAIIKDSAAASFKMANLTLPFGTVDQDRTVALRARLGVLPATTPVVTTIHNLDSGDHRTGTTHVTEDSWLPTMAAYGVWANFDSTFDRIGDGRTTSGWTITGTRKGGKAFSVSRSNRWAVRGDDVSYDPAVDLADAVDQIVNNEFEAVKIKKVSYSSSVSSTFRQERITGIAVSVNGGKYTKPSRLKVKAGATLKVRVTTQAFRSSSTHNVTVQVKVSKKAAGSSGTLSVQGGLDVAQNGDDVESSSCLLDDTCDSAPATSLNSVIKGLTSAPRNNDVIVNLSLESDSGKTRAVSASTSESSVVTGEKDLVVSVHK